MLVRNWKHLWLLLSPAKLWWRIVSGASNKIKSERTCILEADESTRMRMGNSIPHHHEDHIAGKGENSLQHYNLVHKFIPMPQALKIPAAKAAVVKELEKLEKIWAWNLTKVRSKKEFTEQGSSASQMTAAKIMGVISRLPGCDARAADAVSPCTQVENGRCSQFIENSKNRSVQTFGFVNHDTNGQNHGPVWKTQLFLLNETCTVILWQDYCWERQFEKILLKHGWEKFQIGNVSLFTLKKDYSFLCMWMT